MKHSTFGATTYIAQPFQKAQELYAAIDGARHHRGCDGASSRVDQPVTHVAEFNQGPRDLRGYDV
jgi:hypothetical protein